MAFYEKLLGELVAHKIEVGGDGGVTIHGAQGPRQFDVDKAVDYVVGHATENAKMLRGMWDEVADLVADAGAFISNDRARRMFVSAIKHLTKQSGTSAPLVESGVHRRLCSSLLRDITAYSQATMLRVVEYRLAIDWVSHLVAYDMYRSDLLKALSLGKEKLSSDVVKIAQENGYGRNLDWSMGERAIPWDIYKDNLFQSRDDNSPVGTEHSLMEQNHAYRSEQGLEDYDNPRLGRQFTSKQDDGLKLLQVNEDKNDRLIDHSGDGWEWEKAAIDGPFSSQRLR